MQLSLHEELYVIFKLDGKHNTVYSSYPKCKNCVHNHSRDRQQCSLYKRTIRVLGEGRRHTFSSSKVTNISTCILQNVVVHVIRVEKLISLMCTL